MRVYLPSTTTGLRDLVEAGSMGGASTTAFAVTPGLREWYVDDDVEELEYAATMEAARASLRMLDGDPEAARRRVVLAADVADNAVTVRDDLDRAVVQIAGPVRAGADRRPARRRCRGRDWPSQRRHSRSRRPTSATRPRRTRWTTRRASSCAGTPTRRSRHSSICSEPGAGATTALLRGGGRVARSRHGRNHPPACAGQRTDPQLRPGQRRARDPRGRAA